MIWAKVSKGEVLSVSPSPLSKDITLIFPVDFFMIVLITTELAMYSIISTMMCAFDFSNSWATGFSLLPGVSFPPVLSLVFMMLSFYWFFGPVIGQKY